MPATYPTAAHQTTHQTWTDERIELLKSHFAAGLSCREIAYDIGVSRNAVIGKLSRLNLTRGAIRSERRTEHKARRQKAGSRQARQANPRQQYAMLAEIYPDTVDRGLIEEPIDEGNRCSLLELEENRCRWPINTPGDADFCFCGNASPDGQSYCPGHSRLAYRPNSRLRILRLAGG